MANTRVNNWILVAMFWTGLIFFSSSSFAGVWCEHAFNSACAFIFGDLNFYRPPYQLIHFLAHKVVHVALFFIFALLLWKALPTVRGKMASILSIGSLVGSCSEILQMFFPGRDPAIRDVLINFGATAAGVGFNVVLLRLQRESLFSLI